MDTNCRWMALWDCMLEATYIKFGAHSGDPEFVFVIIICVRANKQGRFKQEGLWAIELVQGSVHACAAK